MRVTYIHTNTVLSSWTLWSGASTLERAGYDVQDVAIPCNDLGQVLPCPRLCVSGPELDTSDVVLVAGPEYVHGWITGIWGERWPRSKAVGLILESTRLPGSRLPFGHARSLVSRAFWTDPRDGQVCPAGVDCEMFRPGTRAKRGTGFVGTLYPARARFLAALNRHLQDPVVACDPQVRDKLGRPMPFEWTEFYRDCLRNLEILVSLPSQNPCTVARPFEALACGTFLLEATELPAPFVSGAHYVKYDPANLPDLAAKVRHYREHPVERESIAKAGLECMLEHFKVEQVWTKILAPGPDLS